jgi:hypothetical protein
MSNGKPSKNIAVKKELQGITSKTPTSASDLVNVTARGDGSIMLRFLSFLNTAEAIENHRTVIAAETAISLIDIMANATKHFPKKPTAKPKAKKESNKKTTKK